MVKDEKECCPLFNPEKWDKKAFVWDKKLFIKESIPTLFHFPFPPMIAKAVGKMCSFADNADADIKDKSEMLLLFNDPSAFKTDMYYSVTKEVEGAGNTSISGSFETRVFDGPFKMVPVYMKEMDSYLSDNNKKAKDYYIHFAYCPKCAVKYKHNYMILFAQI